MNTYTDQYHIAQALAAKPTNASKRILSPLQDGQVPLLSDNDIQCHGSTDFVANNNLQQQLCEQQKEVDGLQRQLAQVTPERDRPVSQLAVELSYTQSTLQHETHESNVQRAGDQGHFPSNILHSNQSLFPQHLMTDTKGNIRNYIIEDVIGKGSYGRVVKAFAVTKKHKLLALKIVESDDDASIQEVCVLRRVHHVNIVKLYDCITDSTTGTRGIVLEHCNMDLLGYIEDHGMFSTAQVREITLAVVKALRYLHPLGIAHCDIKPENILLNIDPSTPLHQSQVKLCDFGLSVSSKPSEDDCVQDNMVRGTNCYFAPEMALALYNGTPYDCKAADMWSVGALLLALTSEMGEDWERDYECFNDSEDDPKRQCFTMCLEGTLFDLNARNRDCCNPSYFDLALRLVKMEPTERLTAHRALKHPFLYEEAN